MATYGLRYKFTFSDEDENTDFTVELYQLGYDHGVEPDLVPAADPVTFGLRPTDDDGGSNPAWTIALSAMTIQVIDRAGRLSGLGAIEQKEVKAILKAGDTTIFEGFAVPGEYTYDRHLDDSATIRFVRAESFMSSQLYVNVVGEKFTGLATAIDIIRNCFTGAGNTGFLITGCYWVPWLDSQLTSGMDPLARVVLNHAEFVDNDGNPITRWSVLKLVLEHFQLQLLNDVNSWYLVQRRKVVDEGENTFQVFVHTSPGSYAPLDLTYMLDIWDDERTTLRGYKIGHTAPYKYVSATYNHLTADEGVLFFGGFEQAGFTDDDILKPPIWVGNNVWIMSSGVAGIELGAPGASFISTRTGRRGNSGKALYLDTVYTGEGGFTGPGDFVSVPHAYQVTEGFIEGSDVRSLLIKASFAVQFALDLAADFTIDVYACIRVKVGNYWLVPGASPNAYEWTDSPAGNEEYIVVQIREPGVLWHEITLRTIALNDGETAIFGQLRIELYAALENENGLGQVTTRNGWDDVGFEVIGPDDGGLNEALQSTAIYSDSQNTYGPEPAILLFGDGPTIGHKRRMRIYDGEGDLVDTPDDWQFGRDFGGSPSGLSHLEHWTKERLRQHEVPLLTGQMQIKIHGELGDTLPPHVTLRDRRRLALAAPASTTDTEIVVTADTTAEVYQYGVIVPRRNVLIGGTDEIEVLHAVLTDEAAGEWTLYLAGALTTDYNAGDPVIQDIFWTWTDYQYSCRRGIVSLNVVELLIGDEPDVTCSYDVQPGTLQATSLPSLVGLPCASEISPPAAGTVFMGLAGNGDLDNDDTGIYSLNESFDMASFTMVMPTDSRPRLLIPINSRRELLYQLEGELNKIYVVSMDTFSSPAEWLDVWPDDVQGMAINETDEEILVTIDDASTALNDRIIVYNYDGNLLRSSNNPPVSVETGCLGVDPINRRIYMRHNPGVRSVSQFHLDTLAYIGAEAVHVYGSMGPVEYNSVDGKLYWYEGQSGYLNIHVKTPSGNQTGSEIVLYNPINAFTQMYYSKLHGELLVGSGAGLRLPPTGAGVSATSILTGLDISPLCAGICVYEPLGGHTAP